MGQASVATAIVRLFAVYLVILAFQNAGMSLFFFTTNSEFGSTGWVEFYLSLTSIAVPVLGAALLWIRPSVVTGPVTKVAGHRADSELDGRSVFSIGAALIGLYLMATSLVAIFEWLLFHFQMRAEFVNPPSDYFFRLYADGLLFLVGGLFFLGSSGIATAFLKLRTFGLSTNASGGSEPD